MPFLGVRGLPGDGSKLKTDQKLMANLMNHFSDDGKRVLAAEIKCLFSKSFFEQTCAQKQKRGKILSPARGDQVFDARCEIA